ncbi:hypothetical protein [Pseudogracilibacillus sp. SO10305]|uniref:hypothetical protein n=1 Tax=Pseudogracilibacillus sp. SO10305 TaxID=3098292 RepID=UPI00300DD814
MGNEIYSKTDIIQLVKKYGELEFELNQTTLEKRLQEILGFLNESRVQYLLGRQKEKKLGEYFFNNEMNLTKARGAIYQGYDYNYMDAIFLAVLISLFDQSLFKKIRRQSWISNPEQEEKQWIQAFTNKLNRFEAVWSETSRQETWEIVSVNLASIFYKFTLLPAMNAQAKDYQNDLETLLKLYEELPEHHKVAFYNQSMKSRIPKMLERLEDYIELEINDNPNEYHKYKLNKNLVEIDKQFEK